jgi:hypothetical protein
MIDSSSLPSSENQPEESATRVAYHLHFCDTRSPHKVKSLLERDVRVIFTPAVVDETLAPLTTHDKKLRFLGNATVLGANYKFQLTFEDAFPTLNSYSLQMDVSWGGHDFAYNEYQRKSSESWFRLWTQEFSSTNRDLAVGGSLQLYRQRCDEAYKAEQELKSVDSIQGVIVDAMKRGASFRTSHKEGGTNIYWKNGRYVRSDYGDYPSEQVFEDVDRFLEILRHFCNWDVTCHSATGSVSEIDAWRLIYRRMDLPVGLQDTDGLMGDACR